MENFPKIDEVKKALKRIKEREFPNLDYSKSVDSYVEQIKNIITEELGYYFAPIQVFKHRQFNLNLFRAREFESFSNINLIREHSYPPSNLVGLGRCNLPKFPVFYSSNDGMTALIEAVKANGNTKQCISKWSITSPESELVFQSFLQMALPDENNYRFLSDVVKDKISEPFLKENGRPLEKEREEGVLEYLKFVDEIFINDKNYKLSAAFAHSSLYAPHNFRTDILMYPSVQTMHKGVNLALSPNFVENYLKLDRLYVVSLDNFNSNNGNVKVQFHEYAEVDKNVVIWKKIKPNDEEYIELIREDFGVPLKSKFEKII
ncbi:hypothetical protein SAMN05444280_11780 [Tangfeifania diversioriginum]|uniref:RES domain-containing protein n=1 Tax=Tangfeifania diversioriginum TaxID=1168035 RepID=A0A1M6IPW6_9BACT|nr:hypothetical protein [Tangfeifania diversioriginum]SHJ36516.1 hypothetical protein SAMN05444280_11780 [Tangfeifania diversioriginum]